MLITAASRPEELAETGLRCWADERFVIGWKGHLFLPGERAGAASVARFAALLRDRPLPELVQQLYGVFGLFVHDRQSGGWQLTVDNAGLYKIFYDDLGASTSFLELLGDRGLGPERIGPLAVVEFLAHGFVIAPGTFVAGVRKLRDREILELTPGRPEPRILEKDLCFPADDDTETVLQYFADLATSLRDRRVSADLSGGFDSRLIVGMLVHHGIDFEIAITGEPGSADVVLSARLAQRLGKPFFYHRQEMSRFEEELPLVFLASDGQHEIRGFPRDRQNALARLARGVEVFTHGGGGDQFKDVHASQDFPFYGRAAVNYERYYDLRWAPIRLPEALLSASGRALLREVRARTLARYAELRRPTNHESYDRIAALLRAPEFFGRYFSNYIDMGLDVVAPFTEARIAEVGRRIPPWRRAMHRWHRAVLTHHCPEIAAVMTTDGYTASTAARYWLPDLVGFLGNELRRGARKAGQRLLGRTYFEKPGFAQTNAPDHVRRLRATPQFTAAIARLKDLGVLAADTDPAALPDFHVPRVLTVGMLLSHLEGRAILAAAPAAAVS